jgi:hypothetical protein
MQRCDDGQQYLVLVTEGVPFTMITDFAHRTDSRLRRQQGITIKPCQGGMSTQCATNGRSSCPNGVECLTDGTRMSPGVTGYL